MREVQLKGRLVDDPVFDASKELTKFTIAVPDGYKKDHAHFFDVVAWKQKAEAIVNYFTKGKEIVVIGKLQQERWEKDGQKRSRVTINLNEFEFCGKKDE
jgi:single-strand DNA-binding protein